MGETNQYTPGERYAMGLATVFTIGVITCLFFWVNSCQRTEIIVACLSNVKNRAECIKEMP